MGGRSTRASRIAKQSFPYTAMTGGPAKITAGAVGWVLTSTEAQERSKTRYFAFGDALLPCFRRELQRD